MKEEVDPAHKKILDKAKTSTPKSPKGEYERKVVKYLKKKHDMKEEVEQLEEGRPSQRHPLEGHEYHKKTNAELEYIAKDAHKAAEAMKSHNTTAENKYRDQANDSATVRHFRKTSGTPDWYKKKYGLKEEVVAEGSLNEVMDEPKYSLSIQARQKKADDANKPPFDGPYKKSTGVVTDKSGAKHTPMSRVRDLARKAAQQQSKLKESDLTEADAKDYHTVHVNGRHWKTFETKSHAENVAKKIKGATVQKYDAERLQQNYGAKSAARNAARGKQYDESVEVDQLQESRRANIVREAMESAKKKKKQQQEQSSDKFNADPTLSSEIVKT
jgi:hypothetical protein